MIGIYIYIIIYQKWAVPVSQDKLSPGETVAATEFPRKFCRSNFAERPYLLGDFVALRT